MVQQVLFMSYLSKLFVGNACMQELATWLDRLSLGSDDTLLHFGTLACMTRCKLQCLLCASSSTASSVAQKPVSVQVSLFICKGFARGKQRLGCLQGCWHSVGHCQRAALPT